MFKKLLFTVMATMLSMSLIGCAEDSSSDSTASGSVASINLSDVIGEYTVTSFAVTTTESVGTSLSDMSSTFTATDSTVSITNDATTTFPKATIVLKGTSDIGAMGFSFEMSTNDTAGTIVLDLSTIAYGGWSMATDVNSLVIPSGLVTGVTGFSVVKNSDDSLAVTIASYINAYGTLTYDASNGALATVTFTATKN